ncbi:MAG: cobalamin B12-binding domain-containing protein [Nitrososphaerales archaeon]
MIPAKEELDKLAKAIVSGSIENSKNITENLMKIGVAFKDMIVEGIMRGIGKVEELLDAGEISLFELVDCVKTIYAILQALDKYIKKPEVPLGKVVIGVVEGDTHTIGKDLVATMLKFSGFEVYNLGENVLSATFVEKAKEVNSNIIALSTCMDSTMSKMAETIEALKKAGIRDKTKVLVGGRPLTPEFAEEIGADGYGKDSVDADEVAKRLREELKKTKA